MARVSKAIGRSITASTMLAVAAALLLASLVLIAYQFISLRSALLEDVNLQARIIGSNSAAALLFEDTAAGQETLSVLEAVPYIEAAALFTADDRALASYLRGAHAAVPVPSAALLQAGHRSGPSTVRLAQRIEHDGQLVGYVSIRASLQQLYWRLLGYSAVIVLVAGVSLLVTVPLVAHMRREVVRAQAHLHRLAHLDPVTELPNRHAFNDLLRNAVQRAAASGGGTALALLDLDNFKVVNDTLGHAQGDELLKAIARRLSQVLRATDVVCRIGGDEFALVLAPVARPDDAVATAERVLQELSRPLQVGSHEFHVTASIGTSYCPLDGSDVETLTRNADTAMYHAKHSGKNGCAAFLPDMNRRAQLRLQVEKDLHKALERGEFRLWYQPQVEVRSGRITGLEALLRWQHPLRGLIGPGDFIGVAEECGLIVPLGRWVLREACTQAAAWRAAGLCVPLMAVNVSVRQFRHAPLLADIDAALGESGLPPDRLELEITESMLMEAVESSTSLLAQLRARGIRVSIDDFGTGHSSLSYLRSFPIDALKIDRSFIERIPGDGASITTAILALARSFGLTVVAEGVEREEQLRFLREAGCQIVQGWHFAPALPAGKLAELLAGSTAYDTGSPATRRRACGQ